MIEYMFGIRVATPEASVIEAPLAGGNKKSAMGPATRQHYDTNRVPEDAIIYLPDWSDSAGNLVR